MNNAIREGNPLSAGHCLHGVPMSENCEGCQEPRTGFLNDDYLKGFEDGQATLRPGHAGEHEAARREREDAERYRWLRENSYIELHCDSPRDPAWKPEHLDAAIDKAIDKAKPPPSN